MNLILLIILMIIQIRIQMRFLLLLIRRIITIRKKQYLIKGIIFIEIFFFIYFLSHSEEFPKEKVEKEEDFKNKEIKVNLIKQ